MSRQANRGPETARERERRLLQRPFMAAYIGRLIGIPMVALGLPLAIVGLIRASIAIVVLMMLVVVAQSVAQIRRMGDIRRTTIVALNSDGPRSPLEAGGVESPFELKPDVGAWEGLPPARLPVTVTWAVALAMSWLSAVVAAAGISPLTAMLVPV